MAASADFRDKYGKVAQRAADERQAAGAPHIALKNWRPMRRNFYGFDPSYHVARYHFVAQEAPHSWTPRHLALHHDLA